MDKFKEMLPHVTHISSAENVLKLIEAYDDTTRFMEESELDISDISSELESHPLSLTDLDKSQRHNKDLASYSSDSESNNISVPTNDLINKFEVLKILESPLYEKGLWSRSTKP
jgi:hypothetical protein